MVEASLTVTATEGKDRGRWIPLEKACVVLGRGDEADFDLDDERASRRHVRITSADDEWTLDDLGAANGTYVNGARIRGAHRLRNGDEIRIGRTTLRFDLVVRPAAPGIESLEGRTIGGYRMIAKIGRGVGGVVYRASQATLDREVAVKLLTPKFVLDPAFLKRFVDEARAAARLSHPNLVRVYDGGSDQGYHYFSMELMHGGSVGDLLLRLPGLKLPVDAAVRMTLDAARGLAFAEKSGLIHRDIKPDNLMLTIDHRVKIGDLGIAVRADEIGVARAGTPQYLAPEVVVGLRPTPASDVYGLGATMYRMLSGRTPYESESAADTLRLVREGPPRPLGAVAPVMPREVLALVARLMARDPDDRPQSMSEVVTMLEGLG